MKGGRGRIQYHGSSTCYTKVLEGKRRTQLKEIISPSSTPTSLSTHTHTQTKPAISRLAIHLRTVQSINREREEQSSERTCSSDEKPSTLWFTMWTISEEPEKNHIPDSCNAKGEGRRGDIEGETGWVVIAWSGMQCENCQKKVLLFKHLR